MPETKTMTERIVAVDERHGPGLWHPDIALVRGDGALVWDAEGNEYIDCLAGIAVASVGHGNPRLVAALADQAGKLIAFGQNVGNPARAEFLERLFRFVRPPLVRAFLANSGSEVNEAAMKWARVATGRSTFVAAKRGFSGRTLGVLGLTWEPKYREPFGPLGVPVRHVPYNDVDALSAAVDGEVAAVFIEPVQGEGGMHPATQEYLTAARELTSRHGALLVVDEIQSGVGRTGRFLALEHHGVEADMVTLAKGLAGGVPIGALLMTEAVATAMPAGGHGSTFGGNPLACAAGSAVLDEIQDRDLLGNAERMGERLRSGLAGIASDRIREVRGRGLMIGLELKEKAAPVIASLRQQGVLVVNAGATVIRFVPPLVITAAQVDEVVARVERALAG